MDPLSALGHSHHQNMNHQYHPQFTQDPMQLHMNILGYPQLPLNQQILANQEQLIKLPVIPAEQLFIVPDFLDAKDLPQDVDEDLLESFNERYKTFCTGLIADAKSLKLQEMNSKFRVYFMMFHHSPKSYSTKLTMHSYQFHTILLTMKGVLG